MRKSSPLRRPVALALTPLLALTLVPFDTSPAEARGIKFRSFSSTRSAHVNRADDDKRGRGFGVRIYGFGSGSQDERSPAAARPKGAAAAAAARARAALDGDAASRPGAPAVHSPVPLGETRSYDNGVMCVAGC
jgi:hypothetical protein